MPGMLKTGKDQWVRRQKMTGKLCTPRPCICTALLTDAFLAHLRFDHDLAFTLAPRFTAGLSLVCSCTIVMLVSRLPRAKQTLYQRIIRLLSCTDMVTSAGYFAGRWMTPQHGNKATCDVQGTIVQLNLCVVLWNACLTTNYLVRIVYGWNALRADALMPYYHMLSWGPGAVIALSLLAFGLYGDAGPWCWISSDYVWARMALFYVPLWLMLSYTLCVMSVIIRHVRRIDAKFAHLRRREASSMRVTKQSVAYILGMLLTWLAGSANRVYQAVNSGHTTPGLSLSMAFFIPLQGFFNLLVYLYPRFTAWRLRQLGQQERRQHTDEDQKSSPAPAKGPTGKSPRQIGARDVPVDFKRALPPPKAADKNGSDDEGSAVAEEEKEFTRLRTMSRQSIANAFGHASRAAVNPSAEPPSDGGDSLELAESQSSPLDLESGCQEEGLSK